MYEILSLLWPMEGIGNKRQSRDKSYAYHVNSLGCMNDVHTNMYKET